MKKKLVLATILLALVLLGGVIAGLGEGLPTKEKDVEMDEEKVLALARVGTGITGATVSPIICNTITEQCVSTIFKKGAINTEISLGLMLCTDVNAESGECLASRQKTGAELEAEQEEAITNRLDEIAETQLAREGISEAYIAKLGKTEITIKKK